MAEFLASPLGIAAILLAQGLGMIASVMISLLFLVYGDRKIWAAVQMRRGPNVVGPWGLLQSVADALKYVVKEIVVPAGADHPALVQQHDVVGQPNRGKPVRHQHGDRVHRPCRGDEPLEQLVLGIRIQRRGGLVQHHQ